MHIQYAVNLIEWFVGLNMVVFGINQMAKPEGWLSYIPSWMAKFSLGKPETTMRIHALGNLAFGIFLIFAGFGYPIVAAWIAFIWWLSILFFAFRLSWAIGMRDLSITAALLALIFLLL